ncbi:unnamed protein product, partial [Agarophyton chilense]
MWSGHLGRIKATQHRIELLPDSKPVYQQQYRAGPKAREKELKEVERMLREGVIEPANSDWASPVVLVEKKENNRMRFCVDYRRLNSVTVRDSYPIPRIDECIDSLGDAQVFTTLDANCGYWKVPVEYLGHIIGPGTLEVAPSNIRAVQKVKLPRSQTDIRSFIGLCNVNRRFVKEFGKIAAPLNKKLQKGDPGRFENLSNDEMDTFEELKRALLSPPTLALPKRGLPYTLDTDASNAQIGCCLMQEQHNGDKLPIGYWSRAMNEAEQNYTVT